MDLPGEPGSQGLPLNLGLFRVTGIRRSILGSLGAVRNIRFAEADIGVSAAWRLYRDDGVRFHVWITVARRCVPAPGPIVIFVDRELQLARRVGGRNPLWWRCSKLRRVISDELCSVYRVSSLGLGRGRAITRLPYRTARVWDRFSNRS